MDKCKFPYGMTVKTEKGHEVDPCQYEEIERYKNVTVVVSRCKICGNIDVSWQRQENTEKEEIR